MQLYFSNKRTFVALFMQEKPVDKEFIRHRLFQVFFSLFYAPDKDLYPHEAVVTEDLATGLTVIKHLWTTFTLED